MMEVVQHRVDFVELLCSFYWLIMYVIYDEDLFMLRTSDVHDLIFLIYEIFELFDVWTCALVISWTLDI